MTELRHTNWIQPGHLHEELGRVFGRMFQPDEADQSTVVTSQWTPRVDIKEEAQRFLILADVPGVDPATIEIQMDKGILSIKGERTIDTQEQNVKLTRSERVHGLFYRRFALPDSANAEGIRAVGKHGVLEITIPKKPETTPRRISIVSE